jgi:hypothetical protein
MFRITERAIIGHPASVVWPYLIAFEQVPRWEHGVLDVRRLADGLPKVGDKITARRLYAGWEARLDGEIIEFQDGHFATVHLTGGPIQAVDVRYSVEPLDDTRSIVTFVGSGSLRRSLRWLHPVLPMIGRADARKNLAKLGRRIDAGIPATSEVDAG